MNHFDYCEETKHPNNVDYQCDYCRNYVSIEVDNFDDSFTFEDIENAIGALMEYLNIDHFNICYSCASEKEDFDEDTSFYMEKLTDNYFYGHKGYFPISDDYNYLSEDNQQKPIFILS